MQVALLGNITPNMRAITCGWDDKSIHLRFIFDKPASEDEAELCSEIETEMMASFPNHKFLRDILAVPTSETLNEHYLEANVYGRNEA